MENPPSHHPATQPFSTHTSSGNHHHHQYQYQCQYQYQYQTNARTVAVVFGLTPWEPGPMRPEAQTAHPHTMARGATVCVRAGHLGLRPTARQCGERTCPHPPHHPATPSPLRRRPPAQLSQWWDQAKRFLPPDPQLVLTSPPVAVGDGWGWVTVGDGMASGAGLLSKTPGRRWTLGGGGIAPTSKR